MELSEVIMSEAKALSALFKKHILNILTDISKEHHLNLDDLKKKYIDDTIDEPLKKEKPSKTAKPKKSKNDLFEVTEYEYEGNTYYMDKKSNIYSMDKEQPKLLGFKLADGSIQFHDESDT